MKWLWNWLRGNSDGGLGFEDFDLYDMAQDIEKRFGVAADGPEYKILDHDSTVGDLAGCIGKLAGISREEVEPDLIRIIADRMSRDPNTIKSETRLF